MTVVDDAPLDTHPARNGAALPSPTAPIATMPSLAATLPPRDDDLVFADGEEVLAAPGSAKMLRATRFAAVVITAVIGVASFVLSFASLTDLAGSSAAALADPRRWLHAAGAALARRLG